MRPVHVLRLGVGTLLLAASLYAQNATACPPRMSCWGQPPVTQDTGYAAFWQDLAKLRTTARLMHVAAHPDDEDGGMLTLEARGFGATVLLNQINRGEGGQNKFGAELFDELGVLRTLELLEADQYYGVEQRFTRVVDFGFSKNADETFAKWGGHDAALADLVRVIRTFRPDVLTTRHTGTTSDGHGNHQAGGLLTQEAFRAAGDPSRFPEQIKEGLLPWQPKKLYIGARGENNWTVRLDTGAYSPALGASFAQFGLEGLAHQISQGAGGARIPPGHRYSQYRLLESALAGGAKPDAKEQNFFDGIDTSLPGLAAQLNGEDKQVPFLAPALDALDAAAREAAGFGPRDVSLAAPPLLRGVKLLRELLSRIESSPLSAAAKLDLLSRLRSKLAQFETAAADAAGILVLAGVDPPSGGPQGGFFRLEQTFLAAYPGQTFTLTAHLYNRGPQKLDAEEITLEAPPGWQVEAVSKNLTPLESNGEAAMQFRVTVPHDAQLSRPYFFRDDPQQESVYRLDPAYARYATLPFPPPPLVTRATYHVGEMQGEAAAVVQVKYIDPIFGQQQRPLTVAPPVSVELEPTTQVISTAAIRPTEVRVGVRSNVIGGIKGEVALQLPPGWKAEPASQPAAFTENNEYASFTFTVTPGASARAPLREQKYTVEAAFSDGASYSGGYRMVTRQDLGTYFYYHPSRQVVSAVDVKLPPRLRVGYIMGAGDDIPPVLQQLGLNVQLITPAELASGDLARYDTIVLGIRTYDVRTDVREHNRRLLDYVQKGGTLIVQYNQQTGQFNAGHYTPYPATAGSSRVTVEEAPVEVLAPADRVFTFPNRITERDFDGWVQERGLYFMNEWGAQFTPLLAAHDPGEPPLKGGLLVAKYGQGTYIYCGYAFFRQLPAGVPGAARLFVNLLSVGAKP